MSEINVKNSIFPEEKDEFPWDERALKSFKKLLKDEGIKCRMDDIFLLGFLRSRKFDMQRSLELLKNFYNIRANYPQYFKNLLPSKLEHALNSNINQILPKWDQDGHYIYNFKFSNWDTSVVNSNDLLRIILLILDFQLNFHRTQVKKIECIIDAAGLSLSHFFYFSPRVISSLAMLLLKDSYPIRYSGLHFVNLNVIMKAILSVMIPLLSEKLKKRFHCHSDMKTLHEFIKPEHLPLEYGGNLISTRENEVNNIIKANEKLFQINEDYVKLYEEEKNKNFNEGKFRYIREDIEDEKMKKFIEKSEEKFQCFSDNPEGFMEALKQESKFEITHF